MKIAVVGRGLIGSAAARHLALAGHDVILIGPSEPQNKVTHRGVFGSHYDEGRITRGLDPWPFWSRASRVSIARYETIRQQSGIDFFTERGLVMAGPEGSKPISNVVRVAKNADLDCQHLMGEALAQRFPYYQFPDDTLAVFEPANAGFISPRRLVAAQSRAAQHNGAQLVDATATGFRETNTGVVVETEIGDIAADQALVATGGFSNMLFPKPLPIRVFARTVALFEIDETEAQRLGDMPPLIYLLPSGEDSYLLPPIRYPDGAIYLKLGGDPEDVELRGADAISDWFRSGGSVDVAAQLEAMVRERMPDLKIKNMKRDACVTTYSAKNIPLFERISNRVSIAVAGCGRGAKCSDELGRLGGEVALGHNLPEWAFEAAV